ncbi:MAG TPA: M67 family metallopeptidase, partial [Bryobacteraceae bacterium]|nr:M67 family metallopeptidase [Bryobacteraceae bacterium]
MIRIEIEAWEQMAGHAAGAYPEECCGAMMGRQSDGVKWVTRAVALRNAFSGARSTRYEIKPEELLAADRLARENGLDLIGIYHSHPDHDAYFSETDLKNSCPWYSFLVLSVRGGKFDH